jgi:hypothetical protein
VTEGRRKEGRKEGGKEWQKEELKAFEGWKEEGKERLAEVTWEQPVVAAFCPCLFPSATPFLLPSILPSSYCHSFFLPSSLDARVG